MNPLPTFDYEINVKQCAQLYYAARQHYTVSDIAVGFVIFTIMAFMNTRAQQFGCELQTVTFESR